nr:ribosomal protein S15 [Papaver nudicaule]
MIMIKNTFISFIAQEAKKKKKKGGPLNFKY